MIQSYLKLQTAQTHQDTLLTLQGMLERYQKQQKLALPPALLRPNNFLLKFKAIKEPTQVISSLNLSAKFLKVEAISATLKYPKQLFCIKQRWLKFQSHPAKIYLFEVYKFIPFCKRFSPSSTLSRCVAIFIRRKNLSPL